MQWTEQQLTEIQESFRVRRKRQIVVAVVLMAFLVPMMLSKERPDNTFLGVPLELYVPLVVMLVVGSLAFSFRNWRCPACNKYLGKGIAPRFCQKCGVALQQ